MNFLIFGPGAIGTLFGARLSAAGHAVTVLGRGERLEQIRKRGLQIESAKARDEATVAVVERLGSEPFDWILATIRGDQVDAALPALAAHTATKNVMILANHAGSLAHWKSAVGGDRLAIGFPGAGGTFDQAGLLSYQLSPRAIQATTLGELTGVVTPRLRDLRAAFERAGLPTTMETQIEAWLTTHAAWMSALTLLSPACGYSASALVRDRELRLLAVRAMGEALQLTRALGFPIRPSRFHPLTLAPAPLLAFVLARAAKNPAVRAVFETNSAGRRSESLYLSGQILSLAKANGKDLPAYTNLVERSRIKIATG